VLALAAAGCGGDDEGDSAEPRAGTGAKAGGVEPSEFSATVDNPYFPLASLRRTAFEGTEQSDGETVSISAQNRVLDREQRIAGVPVTTVEVKEYQDGELVEHTFDYYAQRSDGTVFYMGEDVTDYENGKVVGQEGEWRAGEGNAKAGVFMPAKPRVGLRFEQERAPGVAEDRSRIVEVGVRVKTRAGSFRDCIRTRDFAPLGKQVEFKYYCPSVGLVREEDPNGTRFDLISYR
jgi:hypothetical protein